MIIAIIAEFLLALVLFAAFVVIALLVLFPIVKLFKEILGGIVDGILFLLQQIGEFVFGLCSDVIRGLGAIIAMIVVIPVALFNVMLGKWNRAGRFGHAFGRECAVLGQCFWRICVHRPLRLFMLDGLLEGLEKRVPAAVASPKKFTGGVPREQQFDGYQIIGTLPGGGSGATLYVATPKHAPVSTADGHDNRVVIKCFALSAGSQLPQIVRESRALEAARRIGLVIEHEMDDERFYYVMPYHAGQHLGVIIPGLHTQADTAAGLNQQQLDQVAGYMNDLLETLDQYHRNGLWHKDVKPENLIVQEGRAHLVDLGLVTPLRSAMTLTTHGTEYFRDPELVRQALRGVKVNDVDGTKFDIYAAGAVLYYSLENTFPAHGGLSRFSKKSPEALKWIVRRAMAEYHQRYDSVEKMRADLCAVISAPSIWDVRAADLPSMSGESLSDGEFVDREVSQEATEPTVTPAPTGLRYIETRDWINGSYVLRGSEQSQQAPNYGSGLRKVGREVKGNLRAAAVRPLKKLRRSTSVVTDKFMARTNRLRDLRNARKGLAVVLATVIVVLVIVAVRQNVSKQDGITEYRQATTSTPEILTRLLPNAAYNTPKPLLLINDHPRKGDPEVEQEVFKALDAQEDYRLNLARRNDDAEVELRRLAPGGQIGQYDTSSSDLDEICRDHGLSGVVLVEADPHDPDGGWHLVVLMPTGMAATSPDHSAQAQNPSGSAASDSP